MFRIFCLATLFVFLGCRTEKKQQGCLIFVGDVTFARGISKILASNNTSPWEQWKDSGQNWIGNYEGTVDLSTEDCQKTSSMCLVTPRKHFNVLKNSPFVALSIANNHSKDKGLKSYETLQTILREQNVLPMSEENAPHFIRVGNTTWALLVINLVEGSQKSRQLALENLRLKIGLARAQTPWVVVFPHWGKEYQLQESDEQRDLANLFTHWGATLVIGTHPHVIQPSVCSTDHVTYFSLGNHLFDQHSGERRYGAWIKCCPNGDQMKCEAYRTSREPASNKPTWIEEQPTICTFQAKPNDPQWTLHRGKTEFEFVQPFNSLGDSHFFALRRHYADFDHENALRPYVFKMKGKQNIDLWRGTSLSRPLVAARLFQVDGNEYLCAIHRNDTFIKPQPTTIERTHMVYRWNGFGFSGVFNPKLSNICAEF